MSRFNGDVYSKLFPRETVKPEIVETSVETFTPTKDIVEDKVDDVDGKIDEVDGEENADGELGKSDNEQ